MNLKELRVVALELDMKARARLAEELLASLESLSDSETALLWAEEAQRRDVELDLDSDLGRPADQVIGEARARLG